MAIAKAKTSANKSASDNKKTILVVDDTTALVKVFSLKLKSAGFNADTASNGAEALALIDKHKYDAIILDIMMPVMDGFTTLMELKKRGSHIPVIIASNLGQDEDVTRAKALGAVDYFIKSDTSLDEIIKRVRAQTG